VLTASGGQEALKIAEAHHGAIDLLLSDVVLPQISGPALAAQLLQSRKALRVMLMSGYPADAFSANREIANTAFLAKPFTIDELVRTVRSALDPGRPCSA
jgi:two-component system cell cycle sensor histidine kinase/response regulator CckA